MKKITIKRRERDAIIQSLGAGTVPRIGLQHIQVGRLDELKAIIGDFEKIQENGSAIRFVVGDFGSGKTFFLTLSNILAHTKNIVSTKTDITLENTLYSRDGKSVKTFSKLIENLSIKEKPDGKALTYILEKWLSNFNNLSKEIRQEKIKNQLASLKKNLGGLDLIKILNTYIDSYNESDSYRLDSCIKWMRGEFKNISSVKKELPTVTTFINDENYYEYLKLYSKFFKIIGYSGFLISIDELVNLTRQQRNIRDRNYETILKMINNSLQGSNEGLMFIFGGTPDFIFDKRKGLYSYGALETRLSRGNIDTSRFKNFNTPLIQLENLQKEEYLQLFQNIRDVFSNNDESKNLVSNEDIEAFMKTLFNQLGAEKHMSPRQAIKDFVYILGVLQDNSEINFQEILKTHKFSNEEKSDFQNGNVSI